MVKRSDGIKERLQISRKMMNPVYSKTTEKIEKFLKETMEKHMPQKGVLSFDEVVAYLELIDKHARRISNAADTYTLMKKNGLSDANIKFDEIMLHKRNMIIELKNHAQSMVNILENEHLPSPLDAMVGEVFGIYIKPDNTVGRKRITPSLANKLKGLIKKIDSHLPSEIKINIAKKGKGPLRLHIITSLAEAWCEITGKPIQKLKRNRETGNPYGEFHDFIKKSLELVAPSIGVEESLRDIQKDNMGKLVLKKNQ